MRWIREHKLIASLISLLIVLTLIFVLSVVTGTGDKSFAAFVNNGVTKVSGFFSSVGGSIRDGVGGIFSGASKQKEIDELEEEIDRLERDDPGKTDRRAVSTASGIVRNIELRLYIASI